MPFTFAHPAGVLPLKKKCSNYFNLTALVLGSMSPDFEYFAKLKIENKIGHSLIGFFTFNLPIVIVLSLIFHLIIKDTIILHMPQKVNSFIKQEEKHALFNDNKWVKWGLIFIYSAIIGMFTHTLWDSFTHEGGYFVLMFSILKIKIFNIPIYKLLQHGSSLIGSCIVFKFLYDLRSKEQCKWRIVSSGRKIMYWLFVFIGTFAVVIAKMMNYNHFFTIRSLGTLIVSSITGLFLSITLASILFYIRNDAKYTL